MQCTLEAQKSSDHEEVKQQWHYASRWRTEVEGAGERERVEATDIDVWALLCGSYRHRQNMDLGSLLSGLPNIGTKE